MMSIKYQHVVSNRARDLSVKGEGPSLLLIKTPLLVCGLSKNLKQTHQYPIKSHLTKLRLCDSFYATGVDNCGTYLKLTFDSKSDCEDIHYIRFMSLVLQAEVSF